MPLGDIGRVGKAMFSTLISISQCLVGYGDHFYAGADEMNVNEPGTRLVSFSILSPQEGKKEGFKNSFDFNMTKGGIM